PVETKDARLPVATAVEKFMQAKRNDGLEEPSLQKLQKTCDRVRDFAEKDGLFTLDSITLVHLTNWDWGQYLGTVNSLRANQERVKSFFRFFHNAGVIARNPAAAWKRVKGKVEQVSGFTVEEYKKIADTAKRGSSQKLYALIRVMRYAGLGIID